MTCEFSTRDFEFTHGKAPRGFGSWAFSIEDSAPQWAPPSSFADAKKWARARAREMAPQGFAGMVEIKVLT